MSTPTLAGASTPQRHLYDALVLGGQPGAALAAALLRRRGFSTLLVPLGPLGHPYLHQGFRFGHGPALVPPLGALPRLGRLAGELGLGSRLEALVQRPPLQLLLPGAWLELKLDEKERAAELRRALPGQAEAFLAEQARAVAGAAASDAFFEADLDFPPEGMLARWRLNRQLPRFTGLSTPSPLPDDSPLRGLLPFGAFAERPSALGEARVLAHLLAGPSVLDGGREALYQLLAEKARELGADVLGPTEQVESLLVQGGAAAGVKLKGVGPPVRAAAVVAGCDLEALLPLVPGSKQAAVARVAGRLGVPRALLTVHAVLPERALPRGLGALALVPDGRLGAVLLEVGPARPEAPSPAAAGLRTLSLTVPVEAAARATEAAVGEAVEALWQAVAPVLPFTRRHLQVQSVPWLHAPGVAGGGVQPWPLFSLPAEGWFGITGHPTQPALSRLLLASRQVLPGLGLEGEVLAAARAVERVQRLAGGQRRKSA